MRDADKATHTLHIDVAGPLPDSDDNYSYFLAGALRLPGLPLLIDVRLLATRTSVEVCDKLEKMVAYLESFQTEGLPIGETCRIKRIHSDRAGEFTAPFFARSLINHKGRRWTLRIHLLTFCLALAVRASCIGPAMRGLPLDGESATAATALS